MKSTYAILTNNAYKNDIIILPHTLEIGSLTWRSIPAASHTPMTCQIQKFCDVSIKKNVQVADQRGVKITMKRYFFHAQNEVLEVLFE